MENLEKIKGSIPPIITPISDGQIDYAAYANLVEFQINNGSHGMVFDKIRGATKALYSNLSDADTTVSGHLTSFDLDGFTLGDNSGKGSTNGNTETYVSWNWKAGGSTSSNSDGSITSTVSANITSGFSIVSYTGNGSNATIGHGLGVTPKTIIVKKRNTTALEKNIKRVEL